MEEKNYKIYDSLYNVIGVAPYEEVHTKGLLHQVVHFWLAEKRRISFGFIYKKEPIMILYTKEYTTSLHPVTLIRKKHTKKQWFIRLKNS